MISKKRIKEEAGKKGKKIGKKSIKEIENILRQELGDIIRMASDRADFSGRKTIKKEDIDYD